MARSPLSFPAKPADEPRRLQTLRSYSILDTPAEPVFDEIAALAARLLGTPMALVTLIDEDRQWFKANLGLNDSQCARDDSFCAHALGKPDLMVIPDATLDERFRENPFVINDPNIRFYAGAPLVAPDGQGLGALCVLDRVPRTLTDDQAATLRVLGRQVMAQLELHRLLHQSRTQRQELLSVLDALPAAVIIADAPDGRISFQNRATGALLGMEAPDADALREFWRKTGVRRTTGEIVAPSDWPGMRALSGDAVYGEELVIQLPTGRTLSILISAAPMRDGDGVVTGAAIGFQDVSHMHEVARLKNEFVATVSHELRTPLTSMQGSLQLLLSDDDALPTQDGRDLVGVAVKNSERLVRIVNDILDIAKIEAGQLPMSVKRVEVAPLLAAAMDTVRGLAGDKQLQLTIDAGNALPPVLVDQDRMVQSIVNLLSNAIKFSPVGGSITLRASRSGYDRMLIEVADQGRGIPEDQLGLVFDKFHQVGGANRQGTGLGLSITKAIVEQHGGQIGVTSQVGAGTTFTITLPLAPPDGPE